MLHPEDKRKAITWAYQTAKRFGFTVTRDDGYLWVNTGSGEIGCHDDLDFVAFMSDASKARAKLAI